MTNFKIRKEGFKEIRKTTLVRAISLSLIASIGGLAISYFNNNREHNDASIFPILIPLLLGVMIIGIYRGVMRQKGIFESYVLTLDVHGITREQSNTPTITIPAKEVSKIIKNSNGSFTIKGSSNTNVINIPSQIDEYERLEKLLSEIVPISSISNQPFVQRFLGLLSILAIGLMATVYIAKDKTIVGVAGTVLILVLGYSVFDIQRNKNIDHKTKNGMWWLILVILSIVGTMYFKLTSQQ